MIAYPDAMTVTPNQASRFAGYPRFAKRLAWIAYKSRTESWEYLSSTVMFLQSTQMLFHRPTAFAVFLLVCGLVGLVGVLFRVAQMRASFGMLMLLSRTFMGVLAFELNPFDNAIPMYVAGAAVGGWIFVRVLCGHTQHRVRMKMLGANGGQ